MADICCHSQFGKMEFSPQRSSTARCEQFQLSFHRIRPRGLFPGAIGCALVRNHVPAGVPLFLGLWQLAGKKPQLVGLERPGCRRFPLLRDVGCGAWRPAGLCFFLRLSEPAGRPDVPVSNHPGGHVFSRRADRFVSRHLVVWPANRAHVLAGFGFCGAAGSGRARPGQGR